MRPIYPGPPRRLFEQFNEGTKRAIEAYNAHPDSTWRQAGRKPKEKASG